MKIKNIIPLICLSLILFSSCHKKKYDYGSLTDTRNGKEYKSVDVGGKIWMAENLNYEGDIALGTDTSTTTPHRYYPNNSEANVETCGYLYNKTAAFGNSDTSSDRVQGICPDGWHLPSRSEWESLLDEIIDDEDYMSDFTSQSAGAYNGSYVNYGKRQYYWTSTEFDTERSYFGIMYRMEADFTGTADRETALSVRCVKD